MLGFLKKKEKEIKLADLRTEEDMVARDWHITIVAFVIWILLACLVTGYVFLLVSKGDMSDVASVETKKKENIDQIKLERAVQFIKTRRDSNNL